MAHSTSGELVAADETAIVRHAGVRLQSASSNTIRPLFAGNAARECPRRRRPQSSSNRYQVIEDKMCGKCGVLLRYLCFAKVTR